MQIKTTAMLSRHHALGSIRWRARVPLEDRTLLSTHINMMAAMRLNAARYRRMADETRSSVRDARASIRLLNTILDQVSPPSERSQQFAKGRPARVGKTLSPDGASI
jgi:hypothetical protein